MCKLCVKKTTFADEDQTTKKIIIIKRRKPQKKVALQICFLHEKYLHQKDIFIPKKGIGLDFLPNNTLPISYAIPFSLSFFSNRILLPLQSYI